MCAMILRARLTKAIAVEAGPWGITALLKLSAENILNRCGHILRLRKFDHKHEQNHHNQTISRT